MASKFTDLNSIGVCCKNVWSMDAPPCKLTGLKGSTNVRYMCRTLSEVMCRPFSEGQRCFGGNKGGLQNIRQGVLILWLISILNSLHLKMYSAGERVSKNVTIE